MAVIEFEAKDIPALGYQLYRIQPAEGTAQAAAWSPVRPEISNQYYSLTIDPANGSIASLKDLRTGRNCSTQRNILETNWFWKRRRILTPRAWSI